MRKMTKSILFFMVILVTSCQKPIVEKPERLIDENTMVAIIYDLSILDAIKSQNAVSPDSISINPTTYILKKYGIDSIRFAKSNKYYATDLKKYKEIYNQVSQKLQKNMGIKYNPETQQ